MSGIKQKINNLIDKIFTKRKWSQEDIDKYIGKYKKAFIGYSTDTQIREYSASGGIVSAILLYCLDEKLIDGALVCKTDITEGKVRAEFYIATTKKEVLDSRGSKYVSTDFIREAVPLIEGFEGKLAVVGLPCDILRLNKKMQNNQPLKNKIVLRIGLLCGHASKPELIDKITEKLSKEAGDAILTDYKFRIGNWRGKIRAEFDNGAVIEKKTSYFNHYQNMYFFCEKKCFYCNDHFAYHSDISVGDVWSFHLKENPIKHSGFIARNQEALNLIDLMSAKDYIKVQEIDIREILDGQSRGVRLHYNLSAKSKIGKKYGLIIPDKVHEKTKWHEYWVVKIAMFNWKWSKGKRSSWIFKLPKPILKLYLYFMKGLQSLK